VAAHRDGIEQDRCIPSPLVDAWREAGLLRLWLPAEYGGLERDQETVLDLVEAVAALDGAVAWNLLIAISGGKFAAYLPDAAARAIWGPDPDVILAGSFTPTGRAVPEPGGYRLSGRWPFGSGLRHAAWLCGNSVVFDVEGPRLGAGGRPDVQLMFFPAPAARALDTWHTGGMRGTGSHDFVAEGVAVPEGYGFDIFNGRGRINRPLYRLPFPTWFGSGVAALALGIARHAITTLVELAARKVPVASQAPLRDRPLAQIQVAQAEAVVLSARSFLREAVREAWASLVAGGDPTPTELTRLRLAGVHAGEAAVRAVELMFQAAGSSAVYSSSPLDRCLRDVHVAVQHISVSTQHYQDIGRGLLNEDRSVE
jgi:alkylation response protein AidB-like acyl-CoA dehydrogenase